ncbi:MAG: bifunctional DNA primase/polymerase [Pyrinomonadaceae bacterium]
MSAQPAYQAPSRPFTKKDAGDYNKNSQRFTFIRNRILVLLGFPDKAARVVAGIHGLMNGQSLPMFKAHKWAARQMNFKGQDENADQFMCRAFEALDAAEAKCGHQVFEVRRADGVTQMMTSYERDYLGEAVEWALVEARTSPDYFKNPSAAVTDEILWKAIRKHLPERKAPETENDGGSSDGASVTDDAVIKAGWTRAETLIASTLERVQKAGGDPVREMEGAARRYIKMAQAMTFSKRMAEERARDQVKRDRESAFDGLIEVTDAVREDGRDIPVIFEPEEVQEISDTPRQSDTPPPIEERENIEENTHIFASNEEAALMWAARGVPVMPLYTPAANGVCDCRDGAKCKSPGKHPRTYTGLKEATTDSKTILKWFRQTPDANVGGLTGEVSGVLVVDIDPKSGGDLSLTDLTEAYGDEWLDTLKVRTGSGGFHFFFEYPKGLDLRNTAGKIAPGIDTRANGGYVVLPSSRHVSGNRYELLDDVRALPLPEWLLERLTATKTQPPAKVINFQARERATSGSVIPDGQRNHRLFKVGCGIWGHGEAEHLPDLHAQMLEVNARRCSPPLDDAEVAKLAANIAASYVRGVIINNPVYTESASEERQRVTI